MQKVVYNYLLSTTHLQLFKCPFQKILPVNWNNSKSFVDGFMYYKIIGNPLPVLELCQKNVCTPISTTIAHFHSFLPILANWTRQEGAKAQLGIFHNTIKGYKFDVT